jgi:hypothetical protein
VNLIDRFEQKRVVQRIEGRKQRWQNGMGSAAFQPRLDQA